MGKTKGKVRKSLQAAVRIVAIPVLPSLYIVAVALVHLVSCVISSFTFRVGRATMRHAPFCRTGAGSG